MQVRTSSLFRRRFKKLPLHLQEKTAKRDALFRANPFDSRLGTHKLHGDKKDEWAWWVDYYYRVTFIFVSSHEVLYTNVGTHDEVY